jgi:hypothetical protein
MSPRQNSSGADRETWITVTFGGGRTVEYWGDPEEPTPEYVYYEPPERDPDRETWITSILADGRTFRWWGDPEFDQTPDPEDAEEVPPAMEVRQERKPKVGLAPAILGRESRFKPLSLKEIGELPPPAWLIDGLVPGDGLVVLYGEPRAGKSFLGLDWGLSVATGVPWLGHEVKQGEVVYIYAEGARALAQRANAWLQEHGKPEAPLFRALPVAVSISDPRELSEFVKAVRSVCRNPRLIIIDTLARNFGEGNESLAQDMNAFVRGCDDLRARFPGATILVVHHPGKDQKKGARGSVALRGAVDAEFGLTRIGDAITLKNEKQKDGEEAPPISLELARVTLPDRSTSRVVRSANAGSIGMGTTPDEPRKDPRVVKTDAGCLEALAALGPEGASLADWERAADRANDTFYKSRDRLVESGKVIHDKDNARYIAAETLAGPGPEVVQDGSNSLEVQKVSPEVPL